MSNNVFYSHPFSQLKEAMKEQQQLRQKLMEKQVISSDEEEEQEEANREVEKGSNEPEESGENKDQEEFEVFLIDFFIGDRHTYHTIYCCDTTYAICNQRSYYFT